jgi:hypothetical protein
MLTPPDLTEDEIDAICAPLRQGAAQVRYLREVLRLHVERRPNGRPLVNRAHYDAVRGSPTSKQSAGASAGPVWGVH